ncbi:MAG: hypothetical protein ACI85N_000149 [Gammaproteobacteria bacterium]|jgi:hypothetical protein
MEIKCVLNTERINRMHLRFHCAIKTRRNITGTGTAFITNTKLAFQLAQTICAFFNSLFDIGLGYRVANTDIH